MHGSAGLRDRGVSAALMHSLAVAASRKRQNPTFAPSRIERGAW